MYISCHRRITGDIVVDTFNKTAERHEIPPSVLTDYGLVYTTRFAGYRGGRNQLETRLADLGITQKHTRPNHLTTTGKVERFQQTLKKWVTARPPAESRDCLPAATQRRARQRRRQGPLPDPSRPNRQNRHRVTTPNQPDVSHQPRPTPQRNPSCAHHRQPRHPRRQQDLQRTQPTPHPQPQHRIPTLIQKRRNPRTEGSRVSNVLRHQAVLWFRI